MKLVDSHTVCAAQAKAPSSTATVLPLEIVRVPLNFRMNESADKFTSVCSYSSHPSFLAVPDVWAAVRDILSGWLHTAFSPIHFPTCFPLPTNWSGLSYQSKGFVSVEHCWIVSLLVILEMSNAAAMHTWRKEVKSDRRNSAVELRYVEVARNVRE